MRLLKIVVLTVVLTSAALATPFVIYEPPHQLTEQDVKEVYDNLAKYTGMAKPPIYVSSSYSTINAWWDGEGITITQGFLVRLNSKSELAAILGHEIAHYTLDHMDLDGLQDTRVTEANADKYSIYLMLRAGYDVCAARRVFENLRETEGDYLLDDHAPFSVRINALDFPECDK